MKKIFWALAWIVLASGCFGGGIEKTGTVVSYRKGVVKTYGGGAFELSPLPAAWQQKKIPERALLFQHAADGATITVSSWCKSAFDDAPLTVLSEQLLVGIQQIQRLDAQTVSLAGHEALRSSVQGVSEGQPVFLRSYVLKTSQCVFDFIYLASPATLPSAADLDQMVQGFAIVKDPKSL